MSPQTWTVFFDLEAFASRLSAGDVVVVASLFTDEDPTPQPRLFSLAKPSSRGMNKKKGPDEASLAPSPSGGKLRPQSQPIGILRRPDASMHRASRKLALRHLRANGEGIFFRYPNQGPGITYFHIPPMALRRAGDNTTHGSPCSNRTILLIQPWKSAGLPPPQYACRVASDAGSGRILGNNRRT